MNVNLTRTFLHAQEPATRIPLQYSRCGHIVDEGLTNGIWLDARKYAIASGQIDTDST